MHGALGSIPGNKKEKPVFFFLLWQQCQKKEEALELVQTVEHLTRLANMKL
jgi:hypothetical protein